MKFSGVLVVFGLLVSVGFAVSAYSDWYYKHPDSITNLSPKKLFYLEQKHGLYPIVRDGAESLNVRLVGKWGGGPSWGVTGRDTLVYLSRGSEVVVINFADTAHPEIVSYIQAKRLAARPVLVGNWLYLATSGYIEVFDVSSPRQVERIGRLATPVSDIDVEDTLVYSIGADSFRVFNFADPAHPQLIGACRDSGYALDFDQGYAYLCDRWGLYIVDVRNPQTPHRVGSWGTDIEAVKVKGSHCYVTQGSMGTNSLHILNVSNPASPWQEGILSGLTGADIYLVDTFLFLPGFDVVDIADSSRPRLVASEPAGGYEVWVQESLRYAVTAGWTGGLRLLNLEDITDPVLDTTMLGIFACVDISVKGGIACVASDQNYMVIFDVSNPRRPSEVGRYFAPGGGMVTVLNAESLAYVPAHAHTHDTVLHVVDITDPANPVKVGSVGGWVGPSAMVLRDSFLYAAEPYRFEVFNVANPRQPVWVGRCNSLDMVLCGLDVQGDYAYEVAGVFGLGVIRITDPANPTLVGTISGRRVNSCGVAVRDTFAYVPSAYETLWVLSVADPTRPRFLAGAVIDDGGGYDVCLSDSYAYLGCLDFHVFDIRNPIEPCRIGYYQTPYRARKVACESSYIYVACDLAGISVFELLPVGISDPQIPSPALGSTRLLPNPVKWKCRLMWSGVGQMSDVLVRDVVGQVVRCLSVDQSHTAFLDIDFAQMPRGIYFVEVNSPMQRVVLKIIKL